jgi:uncharacterized protein
MADQSNETQMVLDYLHHNPDFFQHYPQALLNLQITHPHTGNTVSMAERQLIELRDRSRATDEKLAQMIQFGEENDAISHKVHRLSCKLIEANSFEAVMDYLYLELLDSFRIPHVAVRLWGVAANESASATKGKEFNPVVLEAQGFVQSMITPYCGHHGVYEIASWFGEAAPHLKSFALLPLKRSLDRNDVFGAIAMSSEAEDRFYPEMGTLYLSRISELVSAALLRFTTPAAV